MGLLANLRVLATSDVGTTVRELRNRLLQLESDLDEVRELSETRYRRLRKRQRDDLGDSQSEPASPVPQDGLDPRIVKLRKRRMGLTMAKE